MAIAAIWRCLVGRSSTCFVVPVAASRECRRPVSMFRLPTIHKFTITCVVALGKTNFTRVFRWPSVTTAASNPGAVLVSLAVTPGKRPLAEDLRGIRCWLLLCSAFKSHTKASGEVSCCLKNTRHVVVAVYDLCVAEMFSSVSINQQKQTQASC